MNTGIPLPLERFYHWEKHTPTKICFTQPMGDGVVVDITWHEAGQQVRAMASYLQKIGVKPGDNVALVSKNCAHWVMADLAIWMAGAVSVPLYPTLTADSVRQILEHSESKYLFVGKLDDWPAMAAGVPDDVSCISFPLSPDNAFPTWNEIVESSEPMQASPSRSHTELATIIYTSGTTGMPKGVMHTFNSIASGASQAANIYEASPDDRALSYLPLSHVAERMVVEMMQLYQGMHVFFAESLDTFASDLQRARPTIFFAVPRIWAKFQAGVFSKMDERKLNLLLRIPLVSGVIKKKLREAIGLNDARLCFSGAAPISGSLLDWYKRLGIEILEVYGMTENMGYSHSTRQGNGRVGYVGQANPTVEVKIGEGGEVLVRSPTNMIGYYKEPEKTRETLNEEGFLHTGDVGVTEPDGSLKITGRIKEIFKTSKGKYVAPFPIESKLLADAHVEQVCVVGNAMPQPIALVALSESDLAALQEGASRESIHQDLIKLYEQVNATLDPHEKLKTIVVTNGEWSIENGIMTPTLKIKRNVLESRYEDRIENWYDSKEKVQWE
ncbi:MAG: AMP-binding acetyl-CoA synthetase [Pseudomonadales bacterium]|nr:AMP-binding acetyl-CoA synthetase [Pseudomonadales bacterium]MAQ25789.1 AMP-binding acetyl-CoA synthetase [Pseudomonadales bacterium]MBI28108.1 AMP-binding acetyl-CoA synthetase [Pseudomonadales bacterium]TNC87748.1 MAG: AMP-binding acetyl-CoA synthetase [Alcanivorax sp.]HAG94974.1 AMP-binding acetyl-CoA synthetase [Gammaproteobacteria bacterium]